MKLSEAINEARHRRCLTQVQLAALLGVPQPRISEWESGKHIPDSKSIEKIQEVLKCSFLTILVLHD